MAQWIDSMVAGGPLPKWMPEWIGEKSRDLLVADLDLGEEDFRKLENGGAFQRMEAAGGHPLCGVSCEYLAGIVTLARGTRQHILRKQERQKLRNRAKKVEALAEEIEAALDDLDFFLRNPVIELPLRLREYAQKLDQTIDHETLFKLPGPEAKQAAQIQACRATAKTSSRQSSS